MKKTKNSDWRKAVLVYKVNVMKELNKRNIRATDVREKGILGESQLTKIRKGIVVGTNALETLCGILDMQPGEIIEYIPDDRYAALWDSGFFKGSETTMPEPKYRGDTT